MSDLPVPVLLGVLALIVVRRAGALRVAIWQAMLAGAVIVLLTGATTPAHALDAIDWDVMLFLFGMFVVGEVLVESGYRSSSATACCAESAAAEAWCWRSWPARVWPRRC